MKRNCRYIDPEGVCTVENKLCNDCHNTYQRTAQYVWKYDVFKGTTTVKIMFEGRCYMSCEIYGQLDNAAARAYGEEMGKILLEKGVLR